MYRWWKELQLEANFSFTRDRIVENYFGMTAAYFEPSYSRGRIILTMVFSTILILDDIYDVYGTSQQCELFTKCIERFVPSCSQQNDMLSLRANIRKIYQTKNIS